MTKQEFDTYILRVDWTEQGILEQNAVVTLYKSDRAQLSAAEISTLDKDFQAKLRCSRDEWFRALASVETERLRLFKAFWIRNAQPQAVPTVSLNGGSSNAGAMGVTPTPYPTSGWLFTYMREYCQEMESPDSYLFWSGVCVISAALRRKVYVQFGTRSLYPNKYVIFVSEAGRARKGAPIHAAAHFARSLTDINFIDRTTTERLPHDLSYRIQNVGPQQTRIPTDAHGFLCAEELVAVLDDSTYNAGVTKFLLDWWDCPDQRMVKTIKHSILTLNNIHITLLGGTTPDLLQSSLSHFTSGGGMLSRTLFIVEDRTAKRFFWPTTPDSNVEAQLVNELAYINTLQGEFAIEPEAMTWMKKWYGQFRDEMEKNETLAKSLERRQAHMIKLAMILACSVNAPLVLTIGLFEQADAILKVQEHNVPEITRSLLATPMGKDFMRILEHIDKAGPYITHSDLLRKNSPYGVNAEMLSKIIQTLEDGEQIETDRRQIGTGRMVRVYKIKGR